MAQDQSEAANLKKERVRYMSKKVYSPPKLRVHGTVEQLTRMPPKVPGGGDGAEQWPYGKLEGGYDALGGYSRS